MRLNRYDVVEVDNISTVGSVQGKKRPCVIVSNKKGTMNAPIITIIPLTHCIKREDMPVHGLLEVQQGNGIETFSMALGEQIQTICKSQVVRKLGRICSQEQKNTVNKVCYYSLFYGEKINWEEVLA